MALGFNGSANTITGLAVGGLPDGSVDQDTLASSVNTITYADIYHLTSAFDDDANPIINNWERCDSTGCGYIGGVSAPSSGIWAFPVTGIWKVHFHIQSAALNENNAWPSAYIYTTVDNGSNWTSVGVGHHSSIDGTGSWQYQQIDAYCMMDITDTSTCKFKLVAVADDSSSNIRTTGSATELLTFVEMVRLGDT